MTGRMRWVLGDETRLQRLWTAYGVQPQSDKREHSASTVLLDATGRQRVGFATSVLTPDALAHDLALLEDEAKS
jgi:protein SCO1/2